MLNKGNFIKKKLLHIPHIVIFKPIYIVRFFFINGIQHLIHTGDIVETTTCILFRTYISQICHLREMHISTGLRNTK